MTKKLVRELDECWLLVVLRRDSVFLKSVGIAPCLLDDPCPEPLALPYQTEPYFRLTKADQKWLKAMAVAWEPEPAFQLPLDFCGHQEAVRETEILAEAHMKKECSRPCASDGQPLFGLGQVVATPGALSALERANQTPIEFLSRHVAGDWGELEAQDIAENGYSLSHGFRLLSSYRTKLGETVWVITEADRSATTLLLPEEY
jgi:hypothetical protein